MDTGPVVLVTAGVVLLVRWRKGLPLCIRKRFGTSAFVQMAFILNSTLYDILLHNIGLFEKGEG